MVKILIIEDNPVNMKLTASVLEKAEYKVLKAYDAKTGILIAKSENPQLILMDINLPEMDGLTATRIIHADPATKHIKIIALTALSMRGDKEKALAAGCDAYVAKPIRYQEFLKTVNSVLGNTSSASLSPKSTDE